MPEFWMIGFIKALIATLRLWLAMMLIEATFIF